MDQVHQAPSVLYWHSEAYNPKELCNLVCLSNSKFYSADYPLLILDYDKAFEGTYSKKLPNFTRAHVIRFTKDGIITKFHSSDEEFSKWRDLSDEDKAHEPFLLVEKEPCSDLSVVPPIPLSQAQITNLEKAKAFIPVDKQGFINDMIQGKTALDDKLHSKFPIAPLTESAPSPNLPSTPIIDQEESVAEKQWIVKKILQHQVTDEGYIFLTQYDEGKPWWAPAKDFYDIAPDNTVTYEEQFKKYLDTHGISLLKLQQPKKTKRRKKVAEEEDDNKEDTPEPPPNRKRKRQVTAKDEKIAETTKKQRRVAKK